MKRLLIVLARALGGLFAASDDAQAYPRRAYYRGYAYGPAYRVYRPRVFYGPRVYGPRVYGPRVYAGYYGPGYYSYGYPVTYGGWWGYRPGPYYYGGYYGW
jgi:hypothetical protein